MAHTCTICCRDFKNARSLASHKYTFHKEAHDSDQDTSVSYKHKMYRDQSSDQSSDEEEIPQRNIQGGSLKTKRDYLSDEDVTEEYNSDGSNVTNHTEKTLQTSKPMLQKPKRSKRDVLDSDDDESSDDSDDEEDTEDESVDKSKEKPSINLLSAYETKYNYFPLIVDKEIAPDLKIVGDEKLLIDAVISTQSLEEVKQLLNENISIYRTISSRVKFYMDNKED